MLVYIFISNKLCIGYPTLSPSKRVGAEVSKPATVAKQIYMNLHTPFEKDLMSRQILS